ncbi:condensation domain-containing protein, partial [Fulvivirga kasyanovii]|uniref:condensation domain-containing protein n=1 Tax=Fulvivirga kasyanovii TaxID=396812 RepID=UPI0031D73957
FLGRKDQQVKIRGYRVEPGEVENVLMKHELIEEQVVIARSDSEGTKHLVAYYRSEEEISTSDLRDFLGQKLPSYMLPGYFVKLDVFPLNSNGKIDRKQLPSPQDFGQLSGTEYVAPRTAQEQELAGVWSSVLGLERVGLSDNFFEIGGHSLKATQLLSRIYKEMNVRMELRDIFTYPTLGELATLLSVGNQTQYSEILPLEPQDYYAVSHAQKRLWILDQLEEEQYAYNIPRAYKITGHLDVDAFKLAFHTLVSRHESLRTTFLSIDGVPYQQVQSAEAIGFELHYEDLRGEEGAEARAEELARSESLASFNLQTGPLLRARLLQVSEDKYVFVYTLHHIISDGWSEGVLVQDVLQLYEAYKAGKENPLAPLSIHYKDYAAWQNDQLSGDNLEVLRNYWLDQFSGELPVLNLPADYQRPKVKTYNGERVNFWLDKEELDKLKKMGRANDASLFMTLVACVNLLLYRFSGQEDLIVGSPVAGRDHVDLENQIGLYLNTLALRTRLKGRDSYQQLLSRVKDVVLGAFEHQAYPFDCIVQDLNLNRDQSRYPLFDVWVVLQNTSVRDDNNTQMNDLDFRTFDSAGVICNYDLKFGFEEMDEALFINFEYSTDLFAPETAAKFADALKVLLKTISNDPLSAIDDIELISEEEKQRQLAEEESKARKLVRRTRNVIQ